MPAELLKLIVMIALRYPELKDAAKSLVTGAGVSDQQWNDTLRLLSKHSASYFDGALRGTSTLPYDTYLSDEPRQEQLRAGDEVYEITSRAGKRWWLRPSGSQSSPPTGARLVFRA